MTAYTYNVVSSEQLGTFAAAGYSLQLDAIEAQRTDDVLLRLSTTVPIGAIGDRWHVYLFNALVLSSHLGAAPYFGKVIKMELTEGNSRRSRSLGYDLELAFEAGRCVFSFEADLVLRLSGKEIVR